MMMMIARKPMVRLLGGRASAAVAVASSSSGNGGHAQAAPFSSKRRTRFGNDDGGERKRHDKLFSSLRLKQQAQLDRLRESLVRQEREMAAQQQRDSVIVDFSTVAAIPTTAQSSPHQQQRSSQVSPDANADPEARKRRKQTRDFERMMARKAVRQERVKHLPLFRIDSPLWRLHGAEHTLLDFDHLPSIAFDGPVHVIHSAEEEREFIAYLAQQRVIGVDTESMPRFDSRANPVCLIQIATLDQSFLYRIPRGGALPPHLRTMLEDPAVIKVGHSLDDDFRLLEKSKLVSGVPTTLDTLPVGTKLGCLRPGLKTLCQLFLHGIISKEMQVSNWEAPELTPDQVRYAATDAWAPLRVMLEMIQLDATKPLLLVKNYNARGKTVNGQIDDVLATLEECILDLHSRAK